MSHIRCNCKSPNYNPIGRCLSCGGFHEGDDTIPAEPTIDSINEAIAIFDGWEKKCKRNFKKDGYMFYIWEFKYHKSWDWLMPIGKKIRDLLQDMLKKRPPHTACHGDLIEVDIHCAVTSYDIEKAHNYIYQFITWYNQQTK